MSTSDRSLVKARLSGRGPVGRASRWGLMGVLWAASAGVPGVSWAQQAAVVYRCPGPPVLYTDTLTPQEAKSRNCKPLTDLPVAVSPPPAPKPAAVAGVAGPVGAGAVGAGPAGAVGGAVAGAGAGAAPSGGFVTPPPGGTRVTAQGSGSAAAPGTASVGTPSAAVAGAGGGAGSPVAAGASMVAVDTRVRPDDQRSRDAEARRILEAELRREEARLNEAVKASSTAKPGERVGADAAQIRRAESDIEAIRRELGRLR